MELTEVLDEIRSHLADTRHAFVAQTTQRDALRRDMEQRLHPTYDPPLEHERFFAKYYDQLTEGERFQFARIRALTDGPMETGNRRILQLLNDIPEARQAIPDLDRLRQHLAFWINKYDHLFLHNPNMCVLYVGVEDRTPFPTGVEDKIVSSQE